MKSRAFFSLLLTSLFLPTVLPAYCETPESGPAPAQVLTRVLQQATLNSPATQAKTEQRTLLEDQSPPAWIGVNVATFKQPMYHSRSVHVRTIVNTSQAAGLEVAWKW